MAPPLSAMAFRDATTTVMTNMAQQQPPMTNSDVNKIPDVNKMPTSTDDHAPDVYKMPTSTDDHVPEASNHRITYCTDNEASYYDNFFDEEEKNQFMSNDEIRNIDFQNYMSVNSHISKQQETLYLQNLVSAY